MPSTFIEGKGTKQLTLLAVIQKSIGEAFQNLVNTGNEVLNQHHPIL